MSEQNTYVVAWTGGYELPSYAVFATEPEALDQARAWNEDAQEGDNIEVLRVDLADSPTITRIDFTMKRAGDGVI